MTEVGDKISRAHLQVVTIDLGKVTERARVEQSLVLSKDMGDVWNESGDYAEPESKLKGPWGLAT